MSIYDSYEYREPHPDTLAAQAERQEQYAQDRKRELAAARARVAELEAQVAAKNMEIARLRLRVA